MASTNLEKRVSSLEQKLKLLLGTTFRRLHNAMTTDTEYEKLESRIARAEKYIATIKSSNFTKRLHTLEEYIAALQNAGFDVHILQKQLAALNKTQALNTLSSELASENNQATYSMVDFSFVSTEFQKLADFLGVKVEELVSIGVLRLQNAISSSGLRDYYRETSSIVLRIIAEGSVYKVSLTWKDASRVLSWELPSHELHWHNEKTLIPLNTLLIQYKREKGAVQLSIAYTVTDLSTQMLQTKFTDQRAVSLGAFTSLVSDLPLGMTLTGICIPGWTSSDVNHTNQYVRDYALDELYAIYRQYVQQLAPVFVGDGVASAYGQGAIAALSLSNAVLSSTILKVSADYLVTESISGFISAQPKVLTSTSGKDSSMNITHQVVDMYTPIAERVNVGLVSGIVAENTGTVISPNMMYQEGTDWKVALRSLSYKSPKTITYNVKRVVNGVSNDVPARIESLISVDNVDMKWINHLGYLNIQEGGQIVTQSTSLHTISSFALNAAGSSYYNAATEELVTWTEPPSFKKLGELYFMAGSYCILKTQVDLRMRIDASAIVNTGSSTSISANIQYTLGSSSNQTKIINMERRYVRGSGNEEILVYEGIIDTTLSTVIMVNGFISGVVGLEDVPQPILDWELMEADPSYDYDPDNSLERRPVNMGACSTILSAGSAKIGHYRTAIENDDVNIISMPLVRSDFNKSINGMGDANTKKSIFALPFNYPTVVKNFMVVSIAPEYDIVGLRLRDKIYLGQNDPIIGVAKPKSTIFSMIDTNKMITQPFSHVARYKSSTTINFSQVSQSVQISNEVPFTLHTFEVYNVSELALPLGIYSNRLLNEDVILLWNTAELLLRYSTSINQLVENLEQRVEQIGKTLNATIDAIKQLSTTMREFIEASTRPAPISPVGVAGDILGFLGSSVAAFFPLIGTAISVTGAIIGAVGKLTDGDVANGALELVLAGLTAGLGLYKVGVRYRRKLGDINLLKIGKVDLRERFRFGCNVKKLTPISGHISDPPPNYDSLFSRINHYRQSLRSVFIRTTDVSPLDNGKIKTTSTVLSPIQASNAQEWISLTEHLGLPTTARGLSLESSIETSFNSKSLTDEQPTYILRILAADRYNGKQVETQHAILTDSIMEKNYEGWPIGGVVNLCRIREFMSQSGSVRSSWAYDRDIILPFVLFCGSGANTDRHLYTNLSSTSWRFDLTGRSPLLLNGTKTELPGTTVDGLSGLYSLFSNTSKNSPGNRQFLEYVLGDWQHTSYRVVITDK